MRQKWRQNETKKIKTGKNKEIKSDKITEKHERQWGNKRKK